MAVARGEAILWGVGLPPADRSRFFSRAEIRQIIELRKEGIAAARTCALLGCTRTELDRWDADRRLSHRFTRRINPGGKMIEARFWLSGEVEAAKAHVESWRAQHKTSLAFRRRKKPLSAVKTHGRTS